MTVENRYQYLPDAYLKSDEDTQIKRIATAIQEIFQAVEDDLAPIWDQRNAKVCELSALIALSWELQTERFHDETEESWRNRIYSAIEERVNAGSPAGLKRILEIFGVVDPIILERTDPVNWDLITVNLDPSTASISASIFDRVFHRWGRTCRRNATSYAFTSSNGIILNPSFMIIETIEFPPADSGV